MPVSVPVSVPLIMFVFMLEVVSMAREEK